MYIHVNYYSPHFLFIHFYLHNCIYLIYNLSISIQQIHKPSVSLAMSVSELQSGSDVRSKMARGFKFRI